MEGEERFIKGLVNKMLRVQISDGRVLVGSLLCTDRDQNLIMGGAAEYWHDETGNSDSNVFMNHDRLSSFSFCLVTVAMKLHCHLHE